MNMRRLRCLARSQTLASSELFGSVAAMASCGYCPSDLVTIRISTMLMDDAKPEAAAAGRCSRTWRSVSIYDCRFPANFLVCV